MNNGYRNSYFRSMLDRRMRWRYDVLRSSSQYFLIAQRRIIQHDCSTRNSDCLCRRKCGCMLLSGNPSSG